MAKKPETKTKQPVAAKDVPVIEKWNIYIKEFGPYVVEADDLEEATAKAKAEHAKAQKPQPAGATRDEDTMVDTDKEKRDK